MGVYLRAKVWDKPIPYTKDNEWAEERIQEFNKMVGLELFVPRSDEATDYVHFSSLGHSNCQIGKQGGKQILTYKPRSSKSIWHEMGHAVGLGHENYHSKWPRRSELEKRKDDDVKKQSYRDQRKKYDESGPFDSQSIMLYGDSAYFGDTRGQSEPAGPRPRRNSGPAVMQTIRSEEAEPHNETLSPLDIKLIQHLYVGKVQPYQGATG